MVRRVILVREEGSAANAAGTTFLLSLPSRSWLKHVSVQKVSVNTAPVFVTATMDIDPNKGSAFLAAQWIRAGPTTGEDALKWHGDIYTGVDSPALRVTVRNDTGVAQNIWMRAHVESE